VLWDREDALLMGNVLQRVAACCSVLQCDSACCSVLQLQWDCNDAFLVGHAGRRTVYRGRKNERNFKTKEISINLKYSLLLNYWFLWR